jgi:WD40 repeat protein
MIEWDLESGQPRHIYETKSNVYSVAIAPDGRNLYCGTEDGEIQIWRTGANLPTRRIRAHEQAVEELCVSPDGKSLLSAGSTDGTARLWDLPTGGQIHEFNGHRGWIHAITISQDGQWALTGGQGVLSLWDLKTGKAAASISSNREFHSVAFAPDSDLIYGSIWRADLKAGTVFAWRLDDLR